MQVTDEMVAKAVEAYTAKCGGWYTAGTNSMRSALTAALGAMWRPVESELPKMDEVVLVSYNSGFNGQPVIAFGARVDSGEGWLWGVKHGYGSGVHLDKDAGWNDVEADDDYQVTHWQPLTAPLLAPQQLATAPCSPPPHRSRTMTDVLAEIDRPDGIIPATPKSVGALVGEIRRLRAALGAMWRPISEAPKDVPVFAWGNNWNWRHGHVGYLHSDYNGHRDVICRGGMAGAPFRLGGHDAPTHFMPLPSPPAQEEG